MTTLKVGGVPEHVNFPWHYALEEGLFSDAEISLTWKDYPQGSGAMVADLRKQELDMAVLLTESAVNAIANNVNIKILQQYVQSPLTWGIYTNPGFKGTIADLKGSKYAISRKGSGSHLMAYVDAQKRNWNTSQLQFVEVGDIESACEHISTESAKLFLWETFTTQPYVDAHKLLKIGECNSPWPCFVIAVRREVLINRYDVVKKTIETVLKTIKLIQKKEDLAQLIATRYHLKVEDTIKWLSTIEWATQPGVKYSKLKPVVTTLYDLKIIQNQPQEKDLFV